MQQSEAFLVKKSWLWFFDFANNLNMKSDSAVVKYWTRISSGDPIIEKNIEGVVNANRGEPRYGYFE